MNTLAFCSISALDRPLVAAAQLAVGAGLGAIEVTARAPHLDADAGVAAARAAGRAVRAAGAEVVAYGSYLGRPERSQPEHAARDVAVAEALATPRLRVWAEPTPAGAADGEEADRRRVATLLRSACDAARAVGVDVVVERHRGSFADTPERIERLLADVDRPNLALNYQVLDFLPPEEASAQPADAARLVPLARYFHLKNYRPNPQSGGPLVPGGSLAGGVLDYRAILGSALESGYAGPLTFEFLSFEAKPVEDRLAADVAFVREVLAARSGA